MKYRFELEGEDHDIRSLQQYIKGPDAHFALGSIYERIFRPARKHGYSGHLSLEKLSDHEHELLVTFIGKLEEEFWDCLKEYDVSLD